MSEANGLAMLADFGLATPRMARVASLEELDTALSQLHFPVAIKTAEDHAHKSDVGGVRLDIRDAQAACLAYREMAARLGPRVLIMEMVRSGTELSLGAIYDPGFGPVVILSAGGVMIEFLAERFAALAPLDEDEAGYLLGKLRMSALLDGYRGQPPANRQAVVAQLVRFSQMVAALDDSISEIDVNPMLCSEDGCFAVDCLVVPGDRK